MITQIAIIKNKENSLTADEIVEMIGDKTIPILWVSDGGQYCLIPKEVIQNLLDLREGLQQAQASEYKAPTLQWVREQGIKVDDKIGRILTGE